MRLAIAAAVRRTLALIQLRNLLLPHLVGVVLDLTGMRSLFVSRVFLGVHFPGDIFVGSMIGSLGAVLVLLVAYPWIHNRLYKYQRLSDPTLGWVIIGSVRVPLASWYAARRVV